MKTLKAKQINRSEEQRNNFVMVYGNDFIQHILGIKNRGQVSYPIHVYVAI